MKYHHVGVYFDSDTIRYQFSQFKKIQPIKEFTSFLDIDLFCATALSIRIAALHVPYPFQYSFLDKVNKLRTFCNHVYIIATEVHPEIVSCIKNLDHDNITFYICGLLNFDLHKAKVKQFMDWFDTSSFFYKKWLPEILLRLNVYNEKEKSFDILLGRKKFHRDTLYELSKNKTNIGIVTYLQDNEVMFNRAESWIQENEGVTINDNIKWTVDKVLYYGYEMSLSQIIPISVYNKTAFSAVAETCYNDDFSFFTEKTSKPIIAKRLFVMFAGMNYLTNLRKLGFKTFGNIIDESYDTEDNAIVRWTKAWEQMIWLSNQPQSMILQQIKPIVEHNFEVMMTTNWAENFRSQFEQDLVRTIGH